MFLIAAKWCTFHKEKNKHQENAKSLSIAVKNPGPKLPRNTWLQFKFMIHAKRARCVKGCSLLLFGGLFFIFFFSNQTLTLQFGGSCCSFHESLRCCFFFTVPNAVLLRRSSWYNAQHKKTEMHKAPSARTTTTVKGKIGQKLKVVKIKINDCRADN